MSNKFARSGSILLLFLFSSFISLSAQHYSKFIIIDQIGYLPDAKKIAVIKNPQTGFDAHAEFNPGNSYAIVNAISGDIVFTDAPVAWKNGITNESSGDQIWHFDFSEVSEKGSYYILDIENNVRSFEFKISPSVYNEVLKQAVRTFFYQRSGFEKEVQYAGEEWADGASHIGPLQDKNCRLFSDKDNAATERDVHGGWYDAGDYNKYTSWTANYIVEMMKMYLERPEAWADNYNIPESGNGIPDLLDEAKWGIDHLLRLQFDDGSVISIVDEANGSPPSTATGQSLYGPPNTSATLNTAGALAISSDVFASIGMTDYADTLLIRAEKAWDWAETYPDSLFNNNDPAYNSVGIGAGQMETDDYGRDMAKLEAACFLFDATGKTLYREYFDNNYTSSHFIQWSFAYPFESSNQDVLLYYTNIENATSTVISDIKTRYMNAMNNGDENFPAYYNTKDPYLAHIKDYVWGSNGIKSRKGSMFYNIIEHNIDETKNDDARDAATSYINYIHGLNPLNMIYLTNMYPYGGEHGVNEFYHSWFADGSELWDRTGTSTYGPPPGFLTGGSNPSYNWADCCPGGCGSADNNAACTSESIAPPKNQPNQKSYKDFNTSWPLNSWEVTENSCGYQVSYIRLLSKFVDTTYDCNGDLNGDAYLDACGSCVGGNTGIDPVEDPSNCPTPELMEFIYGRTCGQYTSPSGNFIWDSSGTYTDTVITPAGWNKIVTINLIVGEESTTSIDTFACDNYISPSGSFVWDSPGQYTDTLKNQAGCDSIITINLSLGYSSDENTLYPEVCGFFTSPKGVSWSESGIYTETYTNDSGCDSTVTYKLTVNENINTTVVLNAQTLTASADNAIYQWLDCSNENALVEGATKKSFTAATSGSYAVRLVQDECIDTSACYNVEVTQVMYNSFEGQVAGYPNPVKKYLNVKLPGPQKYLEVQLTDIRGNILLTKNFHNQKNIRIDMEIPSGIYILNVKNEKEQHAALRIVK